MCSSAVACNSYLPHTQNRSKLINWNWSSNSLQIYILYLKNPLYYWVCLWVCLSVCAFAFTWSPCMCICGRVEDECHFHATSAGNNLAPSFHSAAAAARYFFYSLLSGCFTRFARLSLLVAVAATAAATPATVTGIVLLLLLLFKLLLFSIFTTIFMCWNCWWALGLDVPQICTLWEGGEGEGDTHT